VYKEGHGFSACESVIPLWGGKQMETDPVHQGNRSVILKKSFLKSLAIFFSLCFIPGYFVFYAYSTAKKKGLAENKSRLIAVLLIIAFVLLADIGWAL
jgi:cytochrome c biogenesis protein CcdA